jgi:hypothetical protein
VVLHSRPSLRIGFACIAFGVVVIIGCILIPVAAYTGSGPVKAISFAMVVCGMLGVVITGVREAKRQAKLKG